jgi:hypothetical protein
VSAHIGLVGFGAALHATVEVEEDAGAAMVGPAPAGIGVAGSDLTSTADLGAAEYAPHTSASVSSWERRPRRDPRQPPLMHTLSRRGGRSHQMHGKRENELRGVSLSVTPGMSCRSDPGPPNVHLRSGDEDPSKRSILPRCNPLLARLGRGLGLRCGGWLFTHGQ